MSSPCAQFDQHRSPKIHPSHPPRMYFPVASKKHSLPSLSKSRFCPALRAERFSATSSPQHPMPLRFMRNIDVKDCWHCLQSHQHRWTCDPPNNLCYPSTIVRESEDDFMSCHFCSCILVAPYPHTPFTHVADILRVICGLWITRAEQRFKLHDARSYSCSDVRASLSTA